MLAHKDRDHVCLVSRNGRDHTRRFADLAAAIAKLSPRSLVLDGEVAIYNDQLRSRFEWLREPDPAWLTLPAPVARRESAERATWRPTVMAGGRCLSCTCGIRIAGALCLSSRA
jgi:ATP dependent DNA ligase domain